MTQQPKARCCLAGVVLTYNEENNLPTCLASLRGLVSPLLVIDSGSSDRTVEIARAHGAHVLTHPFTSHARQWRWALGQLPPDVDWVLALDADQYLTPPLREEIAHLFECPELELSAYAGIYLNRRQIFRGHWIHHGGFYPKYLLKLFRVAAVQIDDRDLVDHHFYVRGRTRKLRTDLIEDNRNDADLGFWLRKHIAYAKLQAREELARSLEPEPWVIRPALFGNPDQQVLWLKQRWHALPLYARPFLYFFMRYVVQLGFLDGKPGLLFHFLQAFWYRLLVDVEIEDLRGRSPGAVALAHRRDTE